jgi:hypothetical protein
MILLEYNKKSYEKVGMINFLFLFHINKIHIFYLNIYLTILLRYCQIFDKI